MRTYIAADPVRFSEDPVIIEPLKTFKPNIHKQIAAHMITFAIILIVLVALVIFMHIEVGLENIFFFIEDYGIKVTPIEIIGTLSLLTLAIGIFLLALNYLALKNVRCEVTPEKMTFYSTSMLLFVSSDVIPMSNVTRVSYAFNGLLDKMMNSGSIRIELSGLKQDAIELSYMDETERIVKYLQSALQQNTMRIQEKIAQRQNISNILSRF